MLKTTLKKHKLYRLALLKYWQIAKISLITIKGDSHVR